MHLHDTLLQKEKAVNVAVPLGGFTAELIPFNNCYNVAI